MKVSAVPKGLMHFCGHAKVFYSNADAIKAVRNVKYTQVTLL